MACEVNPVEEAQGSRVRTLYRPGSEPRNALPGVEIATGRLTAPEDVRRVLEGADGAVCVFGPRLGGLFSPPPEPPEPFCAPATATVISEMKRLGIERLVCQTGAMAGGDTSNWTPGVCRFVRGYRRQFPTINLDRDAQEHTVKESGLDWTLVKPFRNSGPRGKGHVRAAPAILIGTLTSVRRADLAEFPWKRSQRAGSTVRPSTSSHDRATDRRPRAELEARRPWRCDTACHGRARVCSWLSRP